IAAGSDARRIVADWRTTSWRRWRVGCASALAQARASAAIAPSSRIRPSASRAARDGVPSARSGALPGARPADTGAGGDRRLGVPAADIYIKSTDLLLFGVWGGGVLSP